jgi:2',3'-cyclic-nucleotide 2'-phosphodiesterase (5'-nucleotidase family)
MNGGDIFSGNPIVDQHEQRGLPMIELMNKVGYDYATFGNHEFDYGQEALAQRINDAVFPFLGANIHVDEKVAKIAQPEPYTIVKVDGIKIAILGLVEASKKRNGEWLPSTHPDRLKGVTFTNPIETALEYKHLRKKCHLFIGLFHTGYDKDLQIAQAMPELDVIIGGHSHTKVKSTKIENGVLITQTQDDLEFIGKTTITLKKKKVVEKKFELINVSQLKEEDPEVKQMVQRYHDESPLSQVLAKATAQFDGKNPLGALMTDAIVNIHQVDFAFQNSGGVRIGMLPKGDITLADVFKLDPFGNTIVVYEMTPEEIRTLLKNSHRKYNKRVDLLPAGLKYTIHTKDGTATQVTLTDMEGKPLNESKRYKVGMNSYISSSYKFTKAQPGKELNAKASDALIEYLKRQKEVTPHTTPRGVVVEE